MTMEKLEVGNNCYSIWSKILYYNYAVHSYLLSGLAPFSDGNETVSVSSLIATGTIPRPHKLLT